MIGIGVERQPGEGDWNRGGPLIGDEPIAHGQPGCQGFSLSRPYRWVLASGATILSSGNYVQRDGRWVLQ
jgi:hypothetical protein